MPDSRLPSAEEMNGILGLDTVDPLTSLPQSPAASQSVATDPPKRSPKLPKTLDGVFDRDPSAGRPALGSGPVDTSLDPNEFKRINQLRVGEDHFQRRAKAQTWWDLMKGSAVQSAAVAFGGTIENVGYLADLLNPDFYKQLAEGERTFESNFISALGRGIQESAREGVPLYQTNQAAEGFRPGDATWWAGNIPSIFSSAGLIIPGGVVGSLAGRAARLANLGRGAQATTRTLSAGLASRHMYSSLESAELYERRYEELLARGYDPEVSRQSAANAAGYNYISGYMNLYKDVVAWSLAFKGINYASRALSDRSRNFAQHAPRNSRVASTLRQEGRQMPDWMKGSRDLLKVGAAESLEEVNIQYQKKVADAWADEILGLTPAERPNGVSFFLGKVGDGSVGEHLKDRHTWDAAFWGFMGGMVFGGLSKPVMNAMNGGERAAHERNIRNIETQLHAVNQSMDAYAAAVEAGDTAGAETILAQTLGHVNLDALRKGTLSLNKEIYQSIIDATPEQIQQMGMDQGAQESARQALEHANKMEKSFNRYMDMELGANTEQIALEAAYIESDALMSEDMANRFESEFESEFQDSGLYSTLTDTGKDRASLRNREIALLHAIESAEAMNEQLQQTENETPMDKVRREVLPEQIEEFKKELNRVRDRRTDADNRSQSELSAEQHRRETALVNLTPKTKGAALKLLRSYDARMRANVRRAELGSFLDPANIEAIDAEINKIREEEVRKAEQQAKKEKEEQERSEERAEVKGEKEKTSKQKFFDQNSDVLTELGYHPEQLNDYTVADLKVAAEQKIAPPELARMKELEQTEDAQSDSMQFDDDIMLDSVSGKDLLKKQGKDPRGDVPPVGEKTKGDGDILLEGVSGRELAQKIGTMPKDDPVTTPETTETVEDVETGTEDTTQPYPDDPSSVHPPDTAPVPAKNLKDGSWPFILSDTPQRLRDDTQIILVDDYAYTVAPGGEIYDAKDRLVGDDLRAHIVNFMQIHYPEIGETMGVFGSAKQVEGTHVQVRLADGTRKLVVDEHGGVLDATTGVPIENPLVRNMALVKAMNDPTRRIQYANMDMFILPDNRIISVSKNNMGEEVLADNGDLTDIQRTMRERILEQVEGPVKTDPVPSPEAMDTTEPTSTVEDTETIQQEEFDQSEQNEVEAESHTETQPALQEFPDEGAFQVDRVQPDSKLYYKSTRNPYGKSGGNEAATKFFENPDSPVVGTPVEFTPSLDDVALSGLPEEVAAAYRAGKPVVKEGYEYYVVTEDRKIKLNRDQLPPIQATLLNEDGTALKVDDQVVRTFLPQPRTVKRSKRLTEEQKTQAITRVLDNRMNFYNAANQGKPIRSKIASRSSGFPVQNRLAEGAPERNNVTDILNSLDAQGKSYRFGIIDRNSYPKDVQGNFQEFSMEVDGEAGNTILFIEGFEGKYYPHKLNVRKISKEEANFAASLIKGYLKGQIDMNSVITPEMSPVVNGLTVKQFFDLLVFYGQDKTNIYTKHPSDYRRNRVMYFDFSGSQRGLYLGTNRYTAENIDQHVSKIAHHIAVHKNRQVDAKGFGRGDRVSNITGQTQPFTWFRRTINPDAPGSYRDFLFNGDAAVSSDAAVNTPMTTQPSIHFESSMESADQGKTLFETEAGTGVMHNPELDRSEGEGKRGYQRFKYAAANNEFGYAYGTPIKLDSYPEGEFMLRSEQGMWSITELTTGRTVGSQRFPTQKETIEHVEQEIQKQGKEGLKKALKKDALFADQLAEVTKTEEQVDQEKANLDDKYGKNLKGIDRVKRAKFSSGRPKKANFNRSIRQEMEAVEGILPPGVQMNIDPSIPIYAKVAGHQNPAQVWGMFFNGMIYLSENAPEGTAYHEAFHAVFNLSLLEQTRRKIYQEAEGKFTERYERKPKDDLEMEEFLADEFAVYMLRDGDHSVSETTDGIFQRLWAWIKNLFSSPSQIDKLFSQIEAGAFAQAPRYDNQFAQSLSPKFKSDSSVFTPSIRNAIVRSLAYNVAQHAEFETSQDITNLDLSIVPGLIADYYMDYRDSGDVLKAEIWGQATEPDVMQQLIYDLQDFFKQMGIESKNQRAFEDFVRADYDGADTSGNRDNKERLFIPTAYEYSNWDSAGANTKLMVSLLPKLRSAERLPDGQYDYQYNEITGDPEFVDGEHVWNLLMSRLSNTVATTTSDAWSQIISKIHTASEVQPSLRLLAERLESPDMPQYKKSEFFNAVGSKVAMNFHTMIAGPDTRGDLAAGETPPMRVAIFESDLYREGKRLVRQWKSEFRGKFITAKDGKLAFRSDQMKQAVDAYRAIRNKLGTDFNLNRDTAALAEVVNMTGIGIDQQTLMVYFNSHTNHQTALKSLIDSLDRVYMDKKGSSFLNTLSGKVSPERILQDENPFDMKALRKLAELHHNYHPELAQNTILAADAKSKWIYSESNYYFDTMNRLKSDPEYLADLKGQRMLNRSLLLRAIEEGMTPEYAVIANVKSRKKFDNGRDYSNAERHEDYILRYNAILKGMVPALNFSDKKTGMYLKGVKSMLPTYAALIRKTAEGSPVDQAVGDITFADGTVEQFANYMVSEIQRINRVYEDIETLPGDELIENYHYTINSKGEMDTSAPRGTQFLLFPQLSKENLSALKEQGEGTLHDMLYGEGELVGRYKAEMKPALRRQAEIFLTNAVRQEFKKLREHRLLTKQGDFTTQLIDSSRMYYMYKKDVPDHMQEAVAGIDREHSAVATAAVNGLMMTIEQAMIMHGDPAFFKNYDDLRKRTSGPAAFRRKLNTSDPNVSKYFQMAVAKDIIRPSEYMDTLKKSLQQAGVNPARIRSILEPYKKINVTDAQALITLDRAVEILRGEGRWRESDNTILEKWKAGDTDVLSTRGGRRVMQLFLTPIKGVHYGMERLNSDSPRRTHVYLKYSQLPILPGMANRSPDLKRVLNAMEAQNIQELVFESGVKVGRRGKRDVSDTKNLQFIPNTLSNENWGRQVETPTKGITEKGLDGTQVRRNILLGLRPDRKFSNGRSAAEVKNDYDRAVEQIVSRGLGNLENQLGVEISGSTGLGRITKTERFGSMLRQEAKTRNSASNVLESFEVRNGRLRVAMELNPKGSSAEALYMSLFKNHAVRADVFGGSYVQASSFAFKEYAALTPEQVDQILLLPDTLREMSEEQISLASMLGKEGVLKPPRIENGVVQHAQVLAPSWFGPMIAESVGKSMSQLTRAEVREYFKDNPELLQFIGYRIPNQGLSSIELLEVVGFLPEDMGDTMVVYEELTTKNDSDFDVDKMFGLMPEFRMVNNRPQLYQFYENTNSKKQLGAIYNDRYGGQGQMASTIDKLDRVRALAEDDGLPLIEIQKRETNIDRVDGEWVVGNMTESELEFQRLRLAEIPTRDEFIQKNMGADPYEINSIMGVRNKRLSIMKEIMSNPEVLADSLTPITIDSLVEQAQELSSRIGAAQVYEGAMEFLPSSQMEIGRRFRSGGNMIGILANHFASHAIATQTTLNVRKSMAVAAFANKVKWKKTKKTDIPYSSLGEFADVNGQDIHEQLSTMMSGFLDATSDSWALELNLTDATANVAALLLRSGTGWMRALHMLNQPVVRELTEMKPMVDEGVLKIKAPNVETHLRRFYQAKVKELTRKENLSDAEGVDVEVKSLPELTSAANLERMVQPQVKDAQYYYDQMNLIHVFSELDTVAASVANFVSSTKFDVDMPGSVVELMINDNRLDEANESGWLDVGGYIDSSFLHGYKRVHNSARAISQGTFLGYTPLGRLVHKHLLAYNGQAFKLSRDKNTLRDINNGILAYAVQSAPQGLLTQNPIYRTPDQMKAMFHGDSSMARRLIEIKGREDLQNNPFVGYMNPSIELNRPDFIEASYRERGTLYTNRLIYGWGELLAHSDPAVRRFAEDLVPYAYATSGMRRGMNTIHDLIPTEQLEKVSDYLNEFRKAHANRTEYAAQIAREILRNEYNNYLVVPNVFLNKVLRKSWVQAPHPYKDKTINLLTGFDISIDALPTTEDVKTGDIAFPQVLQLGDNIYKAVTEISEDNRVAYALLQKKGYHDGEFHIYEYFNPDSASIVQDNQIPNSIPFDEHFYNNVAEENDLFRIEERDQKQVRVFNMDNVLKNKIC